jgi:hypothetical protein
MLILRLYGRSKYGVGFGLLASTCFGHFPALQKDLSPKSLYATSITWFDELKGEKWPIDPKNPESLPVRNESQSRPNRYNQIP